jgi:soluble lytic murein transglycosylase
MSSMVRYLAPILALTALPAAALHAQDAAEWDSNRANLVASGPGRMAGEISTWERLYADTSARQPFATYATFLIANPGFPDEATLRGRAEARLSNEFVAPENVLAYFAEHPPLTNPAKAHYAVALLGRDAGEAQRWALAAWRGGEIGQAAEATILANFAAQLSQADHDARMDALLWQRDAAGAARQIARVSPERREVFAARLAILQGGSGVTQAASAASDPGYLYNRSRQLRTGGNAGAAVRLVVDSPALSALPFDQTAWIGELLALGRAASAADTVRVAARADEAFAPGTDISALGFRLRDDYTSLMWLGGTNALWRLGDGASAAPLFYRYGAAARTPQTRSKGFFWAGEASRRAGNVAEATRYYELAAAYPDRFYGQIALQRLGRPLPPFPAAPQAAISAEARAAFRATPLARAVAEVARDAPWATGVRFYRAIADQAETLEDHLLVAELAREIGRRDLAVILADAAGSDGHAGFTAIGYPRLDAPAGTNWTMVHAISRQESQFAQNAISHAGARGLMQLMPGTAREEAGRAGITYMQASLIDDADYNVRLGSNHIDRLLRTYNGSYPLAIAAYNAGPGNVNKWLRDNGDPRTGAVDWLEWIEKIGFYETKNYVQRVIENAVVYEQLYPDSASYVRARGVEDFVR